MVRISEKIQKYNQLNTFLHADHSYLWATLKSNNGILNCYCLRRSDMRMADFEKLQYQT